MKSCQPWGSRLINKTFLAMQESDKPQHSMIFPDIHRAFLDRVSMSVAIVFPQTARTEVQAYVLWSPVAPPRWHGLLDYRHCQRRVSSCTSQDSRCIPKTVKEASSSWRRFEVRKGQVLRQSLTHTASKPLCRVTSLWHPSSHFWENSLLSINAPALCKLSLHFLTLWIKKPKFYKCFSNKR